MFDHYNAVQALHNVYIHFPNEIAQIDQSNQIEIILEENGYHVYFYSSFDECSQPVRIHPILFNVGTNDDPHCFL